MEQFGANAFLHLFDAGRGCSQRYAGLVGATGQTSCFGYKRKKLEVKQV
jgi:hypothetical protein